MDNFSMFLGLSLHAPASFRPQQATDKHRRFASASMLTVYIVAHIQRGAKGANRGLNRGLLGVSSVFHDPSVHDISSTGRHEDDIGVTLGDFRAT